MRAFLSPQFPFPAPAADVVLPRPWQVSGATGSALSPFTALTDPWPKGWEEVNQWSWMNSLENIQLPREIPWSPSGQLTGNGGWKFGTCIPKQCSFPKFHGAEQRAGFWEAVKMDIEPISESSQVRLDTAVQNVLEREHSHTGRGALEWSNHGPRSYLGLEFVLYRKMAVAPYSLLQPYRTSARIITNVIPSRTPGIYSRDLWTAAICLWIRG